MLVSPRFNGQLFGKKAKNAIFSHQTRLLAFPNSLNSSGQIALTTWRGLYRCTVTDRLKARKQAPKRMEERLIPDDEIKTDETFRSS
jgi:hypothetical protein